MGTDYSLLDKLPRAMLVSAKKGINKTCGKKTQAKLIKYIIPVKEERNAK